MDKLDSKLFSKTQFKMLAYARNEDIGQSKTVKNPDDSSRILGTTMNYVNLQRKPVNIGLEFTVESFRA